MGGCSPAPRKNESASTTAPPVAVSTEELLKRYDAEDEGCRGGSGDNPETDRACVRREEVSARLKAAGWCFGENAAYGYQMEWRRCGDPRFATLAGAEAAADADLAARAVASANRAAPGPSQSGDLAWYVASPKTGECLPMLELFELETPQQVAAAFAREGQPQQLVERGELVLMQTDASDPGMAFVRGQDACRVALAMLRTAGK